MKFHRKIFLVFTLLFCFSIISVVFLNYWFSNKIIIENYQTQSEENLQYISNVLNTQLLEFRNITKTIVYSSILDSRISSEFDEQTDYQKLISHESAEDLMNSLTAFDMFQYVPLVYIMGTTGQVYWYGDMDMINGHESASSYLASYDNITTVATYMGAYESKSTSYLYLQFASMVYSLNGENGVAYIELSTKCFEQVLQLESSSYETDLYVVDGSGRCIYATSDDIDISEVNFDEIAGVAVEVPLDYYDFTLVSITPADTIIEDSFRILQFEIVIAIVALLIGCVLVFVSVRKLLSPVQQLSDGIKSMQNGQLSTTIICDSNDEIGELAQAFNEMTVKVQESLNREIEYVKYTSDLEYQALQAQINPHFICNTLNSLRWMAEIRKADNIVELTDLLWTLLRKTACVKGGLVSLEEELEIVKAFVGIQQIRYNGKFKMFYEISPEHKEIQIPKFILQPIIENAIFHGIEPKKGVGKITIASKIVQENTLVITIQDDGVGMTQRQQDELLVLQESKVSGLNGIGIGNVNERIILLYGKAYALSVSSEIGKGTSIKITIPLSQTERGAEDV